MKSIQKYIPFAVLLIFALFKYQDLFLPYFWDEAWSYIPAIKEMARSGPSMLPNAIDPELYRGHPLLFYFLSSSWMWLFGMKVWVTNVFPLLISLWLLYRVYALANEHFGYTAGITSMVLFAVQNVFVAQSTFFLPEVMLTLFTVLSLDNFMRKQYVLTIVWLTLALYTKESALVIWGVLSLWRFVQVVRNRDTSIKAKIKDLTLFAVPMGLVALFFVAQKFIVGWYFFPEHVSYVNLKQFQNRFESYSEYLFTQPGVVLITIAGILAFIYLLVKRESEQNKQWNKLLLLSLFVLAYVAFSSLNFYSTRYLLSAIPAVIVVWSSLIIGALRKFHLVFTILVVGVLLGSSVKHTITHRPSYDHTLGYRDLTKAHVDMVRYVESLDIYDNRIQTDFLMMGNLNTTDAGYLNSDRIFTVLDYDLRGDTEYAIVNSNAAKKSRYDKIKAQAKLIKRFEYHESWSELYAFERD